MSLNKVRAATCAALLLAGACTSGSSSGSASRDATSETSSRGTTVVGADTDVSSLGLRMRLPSSFVVVSDPRLAFLARSSNPPAILSIDHDSGDVTNHEAEAGETLSSEQIDGLDTVVVTNAAVNGLPPGIVANELLVSNGSRSFSLILSAGSSDLAAIWPGLLASIQIT